MNNNIIEGMTVLKQTMIKEQSDTSVIIFVIGILIAIGFALSFAMCLKFKKRNKKLKPILLSGYILGMVIMLSGMFPFPWNLVETGKYIYECTLDDNVSPNYIAKHFNIVSVEDGVWTITDK